MSQFQFVQGSSYNQCIFFPLFDLRLFIFFKTQTLFIPGGRYPENASLGIGLEAAAAAALEAGGRSSAGVMKRGGAPRVIAGWP